MKNFHETSYKFAANDGCANQEQVDELLDNYSTTHSPSRQDSLNNVKANFPIYTEQNGKIRILGSEQALKTLNRIVDHKTIITKRFNQNRFQSDSVIHKL